jgi:predicted phosphodiesterase
VIAVIADIHGNLWALDAVLAELDRRGFEQVVVGGDLALGGPRPAECVELIRRRGYPTIRGNTDEWITAPPQAVTDGITWCAAHLGDDDRRFLAGLPFLWRRQGPRSEGGKGSAGDLVVVHATPWSIGDVVRPDAPAHVVARIFAEAAASAVVYGHIHTAFVRETPSGLLVNTGSVGLPFDGDWRASFAVLEQRGNGWKADLHRVPYDRGAALAAAHASDNPEAGRWAKRLGTSSG